MQVVVFGRYYSGHSVIHRLDPRVKLAGFFVYAVLLLFTQTITAFFLAGGVLGILIGMSHVPFRYMAKGMRGILILLLCGTFCNLFFTKGEILWTMGILTITKEGIYGGLFVSLRLILLLFASMLLTLTTTIGELTSGLEQGLWFLTKIKVPVYSIVTATAIALRFVPILMEEAQNIVKAQTARGADFNNQSWMKRGLAMIPVLLPLFAAATRRGEDLAAAMDARCYGAGQKRTRLYPLVYKRRDYLAYGIVAGYVLLTMAVFWFGQ